MAGYLKAIERHRDTGIGFQARVEWNAVRNGMPIFTLENDEAAIRDLAGEIITVPGPRAKPSSAAISRSSRLICVTRLTWRSAAQARRPPDALMFDCQTAAPSRIAMAVASATVAWKISANGCSIRKRVACRCRMNPSNWRHLIIASTGTPRVTRWKITTNRSIAGRMPSRFLKNIASSSCNTC